MTDTVRAVSSLVVNKTNAGVQREHFTTWGGRAATNLKHKLTELVLVRNDTVCAPFG